MVSDRIADAEELDINVLRSRGISRSTIIRQYILQSLMITAAAVIPGIILGYIMCKAGASSVDFLSFKGKTTPSYTLRPEILIAVAAAFPVAVIINIFPIIKASANTILTNRGKRSGKVPAAMRRSRQTSRKISQSRPLPQGSGLIPRARSQTPRRAIPFDMSHDISAFSTKYS